MTGKRLTVELPVCPECDRVGKLPTGAYGGKNWCSGPYGNQHKRVHMRPRMFQEVK